jgi:hypothetical protein
VAGPTTAKQRLDRIEAIITPVLVEISALVVLFKLLLDFDLDRCEDDGGDPFRFLMEEQIEEDLRTIDLDTLEGDTEVWMIGASLLAALRILTPEPDEEPEPGANEDDASQH